MAEAEREQFGAMVGELSRLWRRKLNQHLRPLGLSQAQWMVVRHLDQTRAGMMQHELAEKLAIEDPSLVRLLDRMATGGWIERRESPHDRRRKMVHLTRKARSMARRIDTVIREVRETLLADLTAADLAAFEHIFQAITRRAEEL